MRMLFALLMTAALAASSEAQSVPFFHYLGDYTISQASTFAPRSLGDVDGDGHDDYGFVATDANQLQRAAILSGKDGSVLHEVHGSGGPTFAPHLDPVTFLVNQYVDRFHHLGDLNGDGLNEYAISFKAYIIGSIQYGVDKVEIRAGGTHALLATHQVGGTLSPPRSYLPVELAVLGDMTGDGVDDVGLVGRSQPASGSSATIQGYVDLIDGATFARSSIAILPGIDLFLGGMVPLGDVDGDSVPDLAISTPRGTNSFLYDGFVRAISGASGNSLWQINGGAFLDYYGERIVGLNDLDGDGIRDLAAFTKGDVSSVTPTGRVQVLSGASGGLIRQVSASATTVFWGFEEAGDLNGDGYQDYLLQTAPAGNSYQLTTEYRSGFDDTQISGISGQARAAGDLNGDGLDDVLTWYVNNAATPNYVKVSPRIIGGARPYGTAAGGPFDYHWIPGATAPSNGHLELTGASPFAPLVGIVSLHFDTTTVPGTLLPLYVNTSSSFLYGLYFSTADATGRHLDPIDLRNPAYYPYIAYIQYGIFGVPNGVSNAVAVYFTR